MIRVSMKRDKWNDRVYDFGSFDRTLEEALTTLIKYEIGYGGKILKITDTEVVVETIVLQNTDTTTFTGTKEDMEGVVLMAALAAREQAKPLDEALLDKIMERTKGIPLWLTASSGLFIGEDRVDKILSSLKEMGVKIEEQA